MNVFQIKGRLSFQRFLGVGLEATLTNATTVWLSPERLVKAKPVDRLFEQPQDFWTLARPDRKTAMRTCRSNAAN